MKKNTKLIAFTKKTFSTNNVFRKLIKCIVFTIISLTLVGCASTNLIKDPYSPRVTVEEMKIKNDLKELKKIPIFYMLKFSDNRGFEDPYLIWKARGIHEYRFENKTLADYLFDSLIFDLQRVGMNVIVAKDKSITFEEITSKRKPSPNNIDYVVSIDVYDCNPEHKAEWSSVKAFYNYDYHIKIWNSELSKIVYDGRIVKTYGGASKMMIQFADMTEELLNDKLTRINFEIAKALMNSESYEGKVAPTDSQEVATKPTVVIDPNEPWTGVWKVEGWTSVAGHWVIKQNGNTIVSTKRSAYKIEGKAIGYRMKGVLGSRKFSIKMSPDGNSFKGKLQTNVTHYIAGKRKGAASPPGVVVNPKEPWSGTWRVTGSARGDMVFILKQSGTKVNSMRGSSYTLKANVNGGRLEGWYGSYTYRTSIAVRISKDLKSFEGKGSPQHSDWSGIQNLKGVRQE
jgi:hypothetical protein